MIVSYGQNFFWKSELILFHDFPYLCFALSALYANASQLILATSLFEFNVPCLLEQAVLLTRANDLEINDQLY